MANFSLTTIQLVLISTIFYYANSILALDIVQPINDGNILVDNLNKDDGIYCSVNKQQCCAKSISDIKIPIDDNNCFRAAVYEYYKQIDNDDEHWLVTIRSVLKEFRTVSEIASKNGANIIVFPEDGIMFNKPKYVPSLPELVDPELLDLNHNNPCTQPEYFKGDQLEILREFSCIARDNNLYVVANFGTKETCEHGTKVNNSTCPESGFFTYNTNVVIKSDGTYSKRYRKYNLFIEPFFQKPPSMEVVWFDSPMGRFGLFTCFDMMFKGPAIDLVEKYKVDTILFPTLWYDELPILSAIQFQDAWSKRNQVNLLASNVHKPATGTIGSGIYSGRHFVYTNSKSIGPKLILATIPKNPRELSNCNLDFNPSILNVNSRVPYKLEQYSYKNYTLLNSDKIYIVNKKEEKKTICNGQVCCTIDYKINLDSSYTGESNFLYNRTILIVRDSLRPGYFNWYEQVCMLATILEPFDDNLLEKVQFSQLGLLTYEKLFLEATFNSTSYMYPITSHSSSILIDRSDSDFKCIEFKDNLMSCKLNYLGTKDKNVNSFGMYSRLYESDKMPEGW